MEATQQMQGADRAYPRELGARAGRFLDYVREESPALFKTVLQSAQSQPAVFGELAGTMLEWADVFLGSVCDGTLVEGYTHLLMDVVASQMAYEKRGRYEFDSFAQAAKNVYQNNDFMDKYHWGVYAATFAWEHHLLVYDFFRRYYASRLERMNGPMSFMDLGSGSGLWSMLALRALPAARATLVDVSETSVELCRKFLSANGFAARAIVTQGDALTFRPAQPADAGLCCCLLEHMERPHDLMANLAAGLKPGALAFVTGALTAAETSHIFEFRRESELSNMAEECGFRVLGTCSANLAPLTADAKYLPRSMALVLQKRRGLYA